MTDIASQRGDEPPMKGEPPVRPTGEPGEAPSSDETVRSLVGRLNQMPDVRHDLVARVRSQLQQGRYESPEKVDQMLDAVLDDLLDHPGPQED
jgi:hypothetical protein